MVVAVALACVSTAMAASAIVADYVQHELFQNSMHFAIALALVLLASVPLATAGLGRVLQLTEGPITYVGYPVLIALTIVNICHKLFPTAKHQNSGSNNLCRLPYHYL